MNDHDPAEPQPEPDPQLVPPDRPPPVAVALKLEEPPERRGLLRHIVALVRRHLPRTQRRRPA